MKNKEQAVKIKELRNRKGFSQEELSEKSGLSLRTIQRIENGETEPRGDSLKRLAMTFDVSPDEITDWQIVEDKGVLSLLHLSQLGFLAFPILGIIIPLTIWILKKDKIKNVDKVGKSILNFQITWTILLFTIFFLMIVKTALQLNYPVSMITIISIITGLYLFNFIMVILNTVRSSAKKEVYYKPALKILR